jgi:hypothetical protein
MKSSPPLPAPAFCIGQPVQVVWFSEERDQPMNDEGVIVGIACKQPEWFETVWVYCIQFTRLECCTWLPPGHVDWVPENELRTYSELRTPDSE